MNSQCVICKEQTDVDEMQFLDGLYVCQGCAADLYIEKKPLT